MKRLLSVFVLTPAEQRLVIFIVLLLLVVAWFKHHRDLNYETAPQPVQMPTPIISASPGEL
jgi:hypothetical protein